MDKYEDDYHNCTSERIAQLLCHIARRHVGNDREIILEAAKRLRNIANDPRNFFNDEQFSID